MPESNDWARRPSPEIVAFTDHHDPQQRPAGTIAICTRDRISTAVAMSWWLADYSFLGPGEYVKRVVVQGNVLTLQRNECIQKMEGDWILFTDDDMFFDPPMMKKLVETQREHDLDIVGGLCFQRGEPYQPTMYMRHGPTSGGYNFRETWEEGEIVEVDATGLAFLLITKRAIEKIIGAELPSFEERQKMSAPPIFKWDGQYGEDFSFCQEAKAVGLSVFVDTSVKIGHIGTHMITDRTFLREIALRSPEDEAIRRELNDRMGLPTMTREQAREKLGWT
jgi:glycosyltransferase involved in cell wall biosynthesis